ncbi:hypothetical protein wVul_0259 [Wolbachia endosymbiont of Armadillidium vulgare str. wVulC]|uniref:Uncharacterized protein n=1 Tax=Wolbachia endosymbiont of Armadillidium arcangelii TaxID=3158571 RepID=A0AAU7Q3T7_9RICK|nr:hypothetical protein [Wolbachia endosymbiont of Armadillidium vulgare]KLT23056.1 hypothetical protein wVul_0259 [Wolbachia endosymbiont of Armadillidium vulgare str. wVulC]OJH30383.1 hypothetical protein Wxf_03166 [Armadillidium vulgare] [Wolbachia endosymbiont of Armadillidium vulgare]OJH31236.1 hypothetical protein Wxf_00621 [Wolbachia endosymbiont of Armadillidium vulgare]OJH32454.1 hypothetical protein Wxf_01888 [Wolbachia endosymbiont of Armadillidium vulgare]
MAQTSKESVEKKFKDVFERSPGAFPEGTSLEEKVDRIAKGTKALRAMKSEELENKMENIAKLNKELERRQRQENEEIDKLRRSTQELRKEFGTSKRSRSGAILQEARQDTQLSRIEGLRDNKEFQEVTNTLRETIAEGKSVEQSGQKKTSEASAQTDTQPSKHIVSPSVSKSSVKEKLNTESDKKDNTPQPQENQKEEGFLSLLKRFVKKILEKLLGEGKKSVENARGIKEDAQRDTPNNEEQQKSKHFDKILNQDQSISKGLEQATQLENPTITPVNTPEVNEVQTGRER